MVKENKVSLMKWLHLCNTDSTKIQTLGASRGFFLCINCSMLMRKLQLTRSTDNDRTNSYYKSSHYVSDAEMTKKK